jgi:hypothetical protein
MPSLTLNDALRYFFAPFVLFFYLAVYDKCEAKLLQESFGTTGVISFAVTGSVLYFVYRYLIYNPIIQWCHDILRRETYRRFLGQNYKICRGKYWSPSCTIRATKLYTQISLSDERLRVETARIRASGIHLLYQAGLFAIPFMVFSADKSLARCSFFAASAVILFITAAIADMSFEDEELMVLKSAPDAMDKGAKILGYVKNEAKLSSY